MMAENAELVLVNALDNAARRGLKREFAELEAFVRDILDLFNQPDTPTTRAQLEAGVPGVTTALVGTRYVVKVIPPTEHHAAGEHFMVEREEYRIFVVVVPRDVEQRLAVARRSN